jgi:two-component system nitrogen regulation sensor histidine kinase NtrY
MLSPLQRLRRRFSVTPFVEILVLGGAVAIATVTYFIVAGGKPTQPLLTPPVVALLLVANLVPGVALLVLLGRRIAMRRAARSPIGGHGRLHVRLVALFSVIAAVPTLLVVIFASLLFQYGVEFWFSDRARGILDNAQTLATESYQQMLSYVDNENIAMADDLSRAIIQYKVPIDSIEFSRLYGQDVFQRSLAESVVFSVSNNGDVRYEAIANYKALQSYYDRDLGKAMDRDAILKVIQGARSAVSTNRERTQSITRIPDTNLYLYSSRALDAQEMTTRMHRAKAIISDYQALLARSRSLQLKFNAALLVVSLLIVALAVFVALAVADRLVRPVSELVAAARRVSTGDLTARVPEPRIDDEIATLAVAFNQMTGRLQEQTGALESRRALIEAVMSGVSAGVISIAGDGTIRLINRSAAVLLHTGDESPVGRQLADISPELGALITTNEREAIIEFDAGGDVKTLAVKITRAEEGPILTFDDITGQLLDQRRAAWSDVARRIAHEIKNPLTPIQLAAERLQRRYGKQIASDDGTFARLTDTIVRQVGDLRRMVDEFSSFARMPKPVFREESLLDIARQTLFLHEVAHPSIKFSLTHDESGPTLVCDRRQIGQAFTNIVKNAVEAVDAKGEGAKGDITMTLAEKGGTVTVTVTDTGIGLPAARDRLVEPYVTTRARGTGLGLAIVQKIVEEHFGTIVFSDGDGGGTCVTMTFDSATLAALDSGEGQAAVAEHRQPSAFTQHRT